MGNLSYEEVIFQTWSWNLLWLTFSRERIIGYIIYIIIPKAKRFRNKTYKIAANFEACLLCINKIVLIKSTNTIKTSNSFNIGVIIFNYNFIISSNSCATFNHDIWIFWPAHPWEYWFCAGKFGWWPTSKLMMTRNQ